MTAVEVQRIRARSGAVRWTRAAVIALFAALSVLVHHETAAAAVTMAPASGPSAMSGMQGMGNAWGSAERDRTPRAVSPAVGGDDGACSGMAMQHCSTASVDTVNLAPPPEPRVLRDDAPYGVADARDVPGTVSRPPPDLSVLSRLRT
jgi:hypothetical protein